MFIYRKMMESLKYCLALKLYFYNFFSTLAHRLLADCWDRELVFLYMGKSWCSTIFYLYHYIVDLQTPDSRSPFWTLTAISDHDLNSILLKWNTYFVKITCDVSTVFMLEESCISKTGLITIVSHYFIKRHVFYILRNHILFSN